MLAENRVLSVMPLGLQGLWREVLSVAREM